MLERWKTRKNTADAGAYGLPGRVTAEDEPLAWDPSTDESLESAAAQPQSPRTLPTSFLALVRQALGAPRRAAAAAVALLRGFVYMAYYRIRGRRFRAGRNLRVFGRLSIRGPGEVIFGDNVTVFGLATPWTYTRESRIVIGNNVILGPAKFGCAREIIVGPYSVLGDCSIMDTDFHSTRADRRTPGAPVRVASVHIGANVWIGKSVGILPGTRIGENSVVSFGAVCGREYPPNVIISGNPGKVAGKIPGPEDGPIEGESL
jgi:acetyltransferase-like isoleucine patch superfamily enzyme